MQPRILLNESIFHFSESDFPVLIHGIEHSGSSFFTLALLADLYTQNKKFLFFCKSEKAQINFLQLLTDQSRIEKITTIEDIKKTFRLTPFAQGILLAPSDYSLFLKTIEQLENEVGYRTVPDETIVVIKNIDSMPEEIFDAIKDRSNIIVSGNVDRSTYVEKILAKQWNTKILFSNLDAMMANIPPIEKYEAIFLGQKTSGVISIK